MTKIAAEALKVAKSQIGVHEHGGDNKGVKVGEYLSSVGLPQGYAWCQSFVYWCFKKASANLSAANPVPKTAGVLKHWNEVKYGKKVSVPQVGDLFVMDFGKGMGHIGFVSSVDLVKRTFETIEGNSNDEGSREGYEVAHRTGKLSRRMSSVRGFIRY
jgi:uncharacterized protein (TIGR02594 family)